jgi:hypothetical protein
MFPSTITKFTAVLFARKDEDKGGLLFQAGEWTMQELSPPERRSYRFDEFDRDVQLKQALNSLESENGQLKQLVVRLSETIVRIVTAKR